MITDINTIKNELIDYEEIESVYDLLPGMNVKYITIKGKNESFYLGGKYLKMGNNKIIIYNGGKTWAIPIYLIDNNGKIFYKSRFFISNKRLKESNDVLYLKNTINKQQEIINKLLKKKYII